MFPKVFTTTDPLHRVALLRTLLDKAMADAGLSATTYDMNSAAEAMFAMCVCACVCR